jgi:hypothetical protein
MMNERRDEPVNPFVNNIKQNVGREVIVVMYGGDQIIEIKGVCEAIDYNQKSIIIRDETQTYCIPRYLYVKRVRSFGGKAVKK